VPEPTDNLVVPTSSAPTWTAEQVAFQRWLSLPRGMREPKTQVGLARELGVDPATLYRWKRMAGWEEAVGALVKASVFESKVVQQRVLGSLVKEAEKGSFYHQHLYLEIAGIYSPKSVPPASVTVVFGVDPEDV